MQYFSGEKTLEQGWKVWAGLGSSCIDGLEWVVNEIMVGAILLAAGEIQPFEVVV